MSKECIAYTVMRHSVVTIVVAMMHEKDLAMSLVVAADPVPLRLGAGGTFRVGQTRVTLDTVVTTFESGATAEEIALRYPTLELADVYAVIGYYLRHQEEVQAYLQERQQLADEIRQKIEARDNPVGIRARLLARREQQG
jgi:uncharacterized protein (DUF433 family)